jgi:hypothetical protein
MPENIEQDEYARRDNLFRTYMASPEVSDIRKNRLLLLDAGNQKLEARTMLWALCQRDENPAEGCIFFIENFGWTFDPRKSTKHIPFVLFEYQKKAIRYLVDHIDNGRDFLIEKSRDMGVTWIVVWVFLWYWLFRDGVNLLMGSYKEKLVDDRSDDSLFGRLDYAIESLPKWLLPKGFKSQKHRTKLKLWNPANNNQISGDTMNADFGRGSRKTAVFFDELGSWDYAKDAWESTGDVTACRIGNSTPKGRNFYWKLRESGISVLTLHWSEHPLKDEQWYQFEKARRSEEEVAQELDISYSKSQEGRVYPEWGELSVEHGNFPYDDQLPLYIGWDYGKSDGTALVWAQPVGRKLRIVDSYYKTGQTIDYFIPFVTGVVPSENYKYKPDDIALIQSHKNWKRGIHFGDPAGSHTTSASDVSVFSILAQAGIHTNYNTNWVGFAPRKRAVKTLLREGIELNKNTRNDYFNMCIEQAAYPQVTTEGEKVVRSEKPKHDWTSHHRSALEYLALGLEDFGNKRMQVRDKFKPKPHTGGLVRRKVSGY